MVKYIYTDGGVSLAQPRLYARIYPNGKWPVFV